MTKTLFRLAALATVLGAGVFSNLAIAGDKYIFDVAHSSIQFKVSHLGYSWIYGRFNKFEGSFELDEANIANSKVSLTVDTGSVDTNHAKRDKHFRSGDFLTADKFPQAKFVSTSVKSAGPGTLDVSGDFTLMGVTVPLTLNMKHIGGGNDPWGGFRQGYEGTATFNTGSFGMAYKKAKAVDVELIVVVEGKKVRGS